MRGGHRAAHDQPRQTCLTPLKTCPNIGAWWATPMNCSCGPTSGASQTSTAPESRSQTRPGNLLLDQGLARDLGELALTERAVRRAGQMLTVVHGTGIPHSVGASSVRRHLRGERRLTTGPRLNIAGRLTLRSTNLGAPSADPTRCSSAWPGCTSSGGSWLTLEPVPDDRRSPCNPSRRRWGGLRSVLGNIAEVQYLTGRHAEARALQLEASTSAVRPSVTVMSSARCCTTSARRQWRSGT